MAMQIEFSVLGPLEARAGGEPLSLGGPKQRALLAILLLNANRVVSRERLIDELFGDEAISSARHTLRVQISRLRKVLAAAHDDEPRLVTRAPGYLLRVEDGELDLDQFEYLLAEGQRALENVEPDRAATTLRTAESLWRGRALADLELEPFIRVDVERLDEMRLLATEGRIEAELALGRHAVLVPELDSLVAEHPLRERLRAQLMLALYRSGRQAEALDSYRSARSLLVEELALEPSPRLKELEQAILQQHESLELPGAPSHTVGVALRDAPASRFEPVHHSTVVGTEEPAPKHSSLRPRLVFAGLIVAVVVGAALFAFVGLGDAHAPVVRPGVVALLDGRTGKLLAQIPAGPTVGTEQRGEGAIWAGSDAGILFKIDRHTLREVWSAPVGQIDGEFGVGAGAIWMVAADSPTLLKFDPTYGQPLARYPLPRAVSPEVGNLSESADVAVADGSVWVAHGLSQVDRVDPKSGRIERIFPVQDASLVAPGDGAIWVGASDTGKLTEIDPHTNRFIGSAQLPPWVCCLAVGGGFVWASNNQQIWKLSTAGQVLRTFPTPSQTGNIAYGDGGLWVANNTGSITRIDGQTDARRTIHLGQFLTGIGTSGDIVAVSARPTRSELLPRAGRILKIRMAGDWINDVDPAVAAKPGSDEWPWLQQLLYATSAKLLTYRDLSAPDGWQLVPEIARKLPAVSADGRTYTLTIRPGFRFSPPSGQLVTAATFKYSIERALSPQLGPDSPAASVAADIVGVRAFRRGRARHISGIQANRNTLSITLTRPAPDFPERMALSYFSPVPIGTPAAPNGLQEDPIPSAGPYYLSGFAGDSGVLRRNPNYHGGRPQHLDAIVYRGQSPNPIPAIAAVTKGRGDYIAEPTPQLAITGTLARIFDHATSHSPRRYFNTPLMATDELAFNTKRGPLKNARLRIAVNLAIDRPRLARLFGDTVTDRYLPPGIPGYRSDHVYPLDGPNLRATRSLTRGQALQVTLSICSQPTCLQAGRLIKAELERIDMRVKLRPYPGPIASQLSRRGADMVLARVFPPYPDPVAALRAAVGNNAALARADRLPIPSRPSAVERLELHLRRHLAPAAAFGTPTMPQFFSARVACKTFQPLYFGVDLASLCLRR